MIFVSSRDPGRDGQYLAAKCFFLFALSNHDTHCLFLRATASVLHKRFDNRRLHNRIPNLEMTSI